MDNQLPSTADKRIPTRQKIVDCAVNLFASNGYTETSVRDIALAVGINASSLYNHFKSKEDILRYLLDNFDEQTESMYSKPDIITILRENPTVDGILVCFEAILSFITDDPHFKTLQVIYQEHHRNDLVKAYVARTILESEDYIARIFTALKDLNIIKQDSDPDFWKKTASSMLYTYPNRTMIGIGHGYSDYAGMDLKAFLHYMFSLVLKLYGVSDS